MSDKNELATLGGGCFWCIEAVFEQLQGVEKVESGYMGGTVADPTYLQVCNGDTGHAEVVQLVFDPEQISFSQILEIFFTVHDPTTLNRQGADVGTQYRSAVFYHNEGQKKIAQDVIAQLDAAEVWSDPVVTEVTAATEFYVAEPYHQGYYQQNRAQQYCQVVISPKLAKFRQTFSSKLKEVPPFRQD